MLQVSHWLFSDARLELCKLPKGVWSWYRNKETNQSNQESTVFSSLQLRYRIKICDFGSGNRAVTNM